MNYVEIMGNEVSLEELRDDVEAAKAKGLSRCFAFTPETVEALLDALGEAYDDIKFCEAAIEGRDSTIELYAAQNEANAEDNQKLREVNRKQFEEILGLERKCAQLKEALGQALGNPRRMPSGEIAFLMTTEFIARCDELTAKESTK